MAWEKDPARFNDECEVHITLHVDAQRYLALCGQWMCWGDAIITW